MKDNTMKFLFFNRVPCKFFVFKPVKELCERTKLWRWIQCCRKVISVNPHPYNKFIEIIRIKIFCQAQGNCLIGNIIIMVQTHFHLRDQKSVLYFCIILLRRTHFTINCHYLMTVSGWMLEIQAVILWDHCLIQYRQFNKICQHIMYRS